MGSTCNLKIKGSDNPHGVFKVSETSKIVKVKESVGKTKIVIDRMYGTIGKVRVLYNLKIGILNYIILSK